MHFESADPSTHSNTPTTPAGPPRHTSTPTAIEIQTTEDGSDQVSWLGSVGKFISRTLLYFAIILILKSHSYLPLSFNKNYHSSISYLHYYNIHVSLYYKIFAYPGD